MAVAFSVFIQVLIMFILIGTGYLSYKIKMLSEETGAQLSNFLLMIVSPCVILKAFNINFDKNLAVGLLISTGLAVITHLTGIIASKLFIRKNSENKDYILERFATVYSNCGFMAIPLIMAILGDRGVFYSSCYIAVFNIFQWTHGVVSMDSSKAKINILKILLSPPIISIAIGLIIFIFSVKLPSFISQPIKFISDLNTPLAMVITGIYIARTNILSSFLEKKIYRVSFLKLLLIPAVMIFIFMFFDKNNESLVIIATANLIAAACPSAASTLMMGRRFNLNAEYASQIVTVTTLLSIITLPIVLWLMSLTMGILK